MKLRTVPLEAFTFVSVADEAVTVETSTPATTAVPDCRVIVAVLICTYRVGRAASATPAAPVINNAKNSFFIMLSAPL
jgi:hypothetical protein